MWKGILEQRKGEQAVAKATKPSQSNAAAAAADDAGTPPVQETTQTQKNSKVCVVS